MVRLLGYNSQAALEEECPREISKTPSPMGENGWLIRFFDSSFFCEWIAVSYLYKHDHQGVRDYLCNKMYTLPLSGIEGYLFQLCYMMGYKTSAALEKFLMDGCSRSLKIALKVHWFLQAEAEESDDAKELYRLLEKCQMAALMGDWPPLVRPKKIETSPGSKKRMLNKLISSSRLLNITNSSPLQKVLSPGGAPNSVIEEAYKSIRESITFRRKEESRPCSGEEERAVRRTGILQLGDEEGFFRRLFRDKVDDREKKEDREKLVEEEKVLPNLDEEESPDFSIFRRFLRVHPEDDDMAFTEATTLNNSDSSPGTDGFFRRLFKDKNLEDDDKAVRRLFKDKNLEDDDKAVIEATTLNNSESSPGTDGFFRRLFKDKNLEDDDKAVTEATTLNNSESSPGTDGFFRRLFKDRNLEDSKVFSLRREDGITPSNILKKFFKDKTDDVSSTIAEDQSKAGPDDLSGQQQEACGKDSHSSVKNEPKEEKKAFDVDTLLIEAMNGCVLAEVDLKAAYKDNSQSCPDRRPSETIANTANGMSFKRPGSPKQRIERLAAKPPLPKYSSFHLRKGTYHATLDFIQSLCDTSTGLVDVYPMEDRQKSLYEFFAELNTHLVDAQNDGGVCFPLGKGLFRVVHIPEDEATLLNSREKAPYLICVEVLKCDERSNTKGTVEGGPQKLSQGGIPLANGDVQLQRPPPWAYPVWHQSKMQHNNTDAMLRAASQAIDRAMTHLWETKVKFVHVGLSVSDSPRNSVDCTCSSGGSAVVNGKCSCCDKEDGATQCCSVAAATEGGGASELHQCHWWVKVHLTAVPGVNMEDVEAEEPGRRKDHRRVPSTVAMAQVKAAAAKGESPLGLPRKKTMARTGHGQSEDRDDVNAKATDALAGELWEAKKERIRKTSKFGSMPGWDLFSVIVKSGDDCRQEHLAVQLISHFYDIYQEAGLPLWLRPYEVLVTSSYTALIETIPDTASIHSIKSRNPNVSSLREFFCKKYQDDLPALKVAQRNFVESMAGYSILCYFLQVKDRHNGNLLIDEEGHIIHIDFGFMLSNSPGGVNFESAPFKLTRELLEVMDSDAEGTASEFFDYFKILCIQGFLTCRKHAERIILLVEMMQDSGFPCFKGGVKTIQNLRKRFHLSLTEEQCVSLVLSLISNSLDAWRTRKYDYYQRVLNGIL